MEKENIILTQTPAVIGDAALKLFRISRSETTKKTDSGKLIHMHMYYECHLLLHGEYVYSVGDHAVRMKEKQLLIIPPKQEHQPFEKKAGAFERVFGLTVEPTDGEIRCYPYFCAALRQAVCKPISLVDGLYQQLTTFLDGFDEQNSGLRTQCRQLTDVYPLLYALFDAINGFELPQNAEDGNRNSDPAVTLDWMVNDPSCSLEDIAHVLGYSYRHTARKIKEIYGDSLVNLRRNIMLSSAKSLLIHAPEMTLDSIAGQSGFTSTHAMIRTFHTVLGMTPTEYRNQMLFEKIGEEET